MDHEVASVTPLSMSTLEVNLNPVVDKNHTFKKLPQKERCKRYFKIRENPQP